MKKFFSRKWVRRIGIFMGISMAIWLSIIIFLVVTIWQYGDEITAEPSDVIIVLGSGLRRDGRAGDALWRRSLWGAEIYKQGYADAIICTGGIGGGQSRSEAAVCRLILIEEGVPPEAIFIEEKSRSTEQNAIYAQEIMIEKGWTTSIVVTDSFHMRRTSWIFERQAVAHSRAPVPRDWVAQRFFVQHLLRELAALHWEAFKTFFNLPITNFELS